MTMQNSSSNKTTSDNTKRDQLLSWGWRDADVGAV
jgi:hypothetical protein